MLWSQSKKTKITIEALFGDFSPKTQIYEKLKIEAQKLSLPEVRAYRVFQKSAQKKPVLRTTNHL